MRTLIFMLVHNNDTFQNTHDSNNASTCNDDSICCNNSTDINNKFFYNSNTDIHSIDIVNHYVNLDIAIFILY